MKEKLLLVAVVAALSSALASGCGNTVGCDFREGSLNGPEDRCQDRNGLQSIGFEQGCQASGGKVVDGGCPTEGVVGGCDLGQDCFDWFYEPTTRDDIKCDSGEVLDPP